MKAYQNYFLLSTILLMLVIPTLLTSAEALTKSLNEKYVNSQVGFEMVFPSGWYAINETSTGMLAVHGDELDWDWSITMTIGNLQGGSTTSSVTPALSSDLIPAECKKLSETPLVITGVSGFEAVYECGNEQTSAKANLVGIFTKNASIIMLYDADYYDQHISDFDSIVNSFKLTDNANVKTGGTAKQNNTIVVPVNNTTTSVMNKTDVSKKKDIPPWIKNNAKWWSEGSIADNDFVQGIQYLIEEGIMKIPQTQSGAGSSQKIPQWIKNNAGWWANDQISDNDFVLGIQYLITKGIMKI